jgi:hypothetical protein
MILKFKKNYSRFVKLLAISLFISAILAIVTYFNTPAVYWPQSDNLYAVCRLLQSNCLAEDFFTNASSDISPRIPYIYFLSIITKIANNGIGGGLALIKALLLILLPIVISLIFIVTINEYIRNKDKAQYGVWGVRLGAVEWRRSPANIIAITSAPLFVYFLHSKFAKILSIAWWAPLTFEPTAQNFSLLLTISGFLFVWLDRKSIGAIFIIVGTVIHPAVAFFSSLFSLISLCKFNSIKDTSRFICIGLGANFIGIIFVKIFFETNLTISPQDFIRIYAFEAHPSHYIPSQFETFSPIIPWIAPFSIVSIGLLVITIILYKLNSSAWKNSFFAFITYSSSILIQFLFVEINQIKLIAQLGPSRFSMFGAWFLFIFYFIAALKFFNTNQFFLKLSNIIYQKIAFARWIYILACYSILGLFVVSYALKSSDFDVPGEDKTLVSFATTQTNLSDVFILPFTAPSSIFPLKAERAIFFGNGFVFSEKYFKEWEERKVLVWGRQAETANLHGNWIGEKYANHYRSLLPKDFLEIAKKYKINWVVIETDYSNNFSDCRTDFYSQKYKVYSLEILDQCTR